MVSLCALLKSIKYLIFATHDIWDSLLDILAVFLWLGTLILHCVVYIFKKTCICIEIFSAPRGAAIDSAFIVDIYIDFKSYVICYD